MKRRLPPAAAIFLLLGGSAFGQGTEAHASTPVPLWLVGPFVGLLAAIAVLPLTAPKFWAKHYPKISFAFGAFVVLWYALVRGDFEKLAETGLDYVAFICLIGSLFVASGGILIRVHRAGTPVVNTVLLLLGAFLANVFGTTGASAILIRPFLRVNRGHLRPYHVVFFIFIVSNAGGALTPIGDPPLFMGYIKGVPFFWVMERAFSIWALVVGGLLATFFAIDAYHAWKRPGKEPPAKYAAVDFVGIANFFWVFVILAAVLLKEKLGFGVPELAMVIAATIAHRTSAPEVLKENEFTFHPIKEVAILFAGIFATMIPALQYLEHNAEHLGIDTPLLFYFGSGTLSSILDNTPTYLNFLAAAMGEKGLSIDERQHVLGFIENPETARFLLAVSMGAVFFGACTYIGNGPNFMVKSIAEHAGVKCPSFFGYVLRYTLPFLLPWLVLAGLLFFRG